MRGLVQRVSRAAVRVDGATTAAIGTGLLLLVGVAADDDEREAHWLAEKCANLRIFPDDEGKMNRSLLDCGGGAVVVSQFTLHGDARKGRRPSFTRAAPPEKAEPLYLLVAARLRELGVREVGTGVFQTHMDVDLVNDGPVTILLESPVELEARGR